MSNEQTTNTSLRVRRVIRASREKVYKAFLDRASLERWYHPGPMTTEVHAIDPREGGDFRISMVATEGETAGTHTCHGRYLELRPNERIVHTFAWEGDAAGMTGADSRVTVTFADAPGGTEVTLVHEGLPDRESVESHAHGWTGTLENLAAAF